MAIDTAGQTRPGSIPLSAYGHLLTIYLVWGGGYLAVKVALSGPAVLTVFQLQSVRMWCATALLAGLAAFRHGWPGRPAPRDLLVCAASGLLMWVAGNGLATLASRHAASSFIVMAMGAIPLWSCVLDLLIERAIPGPRLIFGLVLGLFGLFLVVAPALFSSTTAIIEPGFAEFTVLVLIGAGTSWSLGTIVQRPLAGRMHSEWAAAFQMLAASVALTVLVTTEAAPLPEMPGLRQWLAIGFLIVFASVIGLTSYLRVLRVFSPVIATTFAYVNPIVGVLAGWAILGEEPAPLSLAGLVTVLASIAIVLSRRR